MTFTNFDNENSNQNIMTVILKSLPKESGLTKIEYEGPAIALYTCNPKFLIENSQALTNMVSIIRKRIVIRTDESIRKSEKESSLIILKYFTSNNVKKIFFDYALGEITIYTKDLSERAPKDGKFSILDLVAETGWKIKIRKSPEILPSIQFINEVLNDATDYRIKFYKKVGENLFRSKLSNIHEASVLALGGFGEIGRSCFLLVTSESKILLDCGINVQENRSIQHFPRLDITGFRIEEIDGVVISHAHIDHIGFLPFLFKYGYRGPVYCTEPTLPLMALLFLDYCKNHGIYSNDDIKNVIIHTITLNLGEVTDITPDIKLTLYNSGHILGSVSTHLHIGNGDHNVVYTGDLKFGKTNLLDNASWNFPRVETLIIEGTFGSRDSPHKRDEYGPFLIESINQTLRSNGKVLIPIPIIGLSQELIYTLNQYQNSGALDPVPIFVDNSILESANIYEMYHEYLSKDLREKLPIYNTNIFNHDNLISIPSRSKIDKPAVILAPSSMLVGGTSVRILKQICKDPTNKILLLSYQAQGTPGNEIQLGAKEIFINGQKIDIRCKVDSIHGFSNHSDYNQLLAYVSRLKPKLKRVIVNHGEKPRIQNLAVSINKILNIPCHYLLVPEATKLL